MRRVKKYKTFLFLIILLIATGCAAHDPPISELHAPQEIDDGIMVGNLQTLDINTASIAETVQNIRDGIYGEVHAMLIYKNGLLVVEEYFPGYDYDWAGPNFHGAWKAWDTSTRHNIHSVGKSITSACIGIAIKEGFIHSVDDYIFDYLPEYAHLKTGGKDAITVEHLLTMTSGLQWDEWGSSYADQSNDVIKLWMDCKDPFACILEKPLLHEPGAKFNYSGGDMVLLGEIIKNASGMDIEAFSWKYLFTPLGIETPPWNWIDQQVIYAGGDQLLAPREMLKFGILYLNNGNWNNDQILPREWVEKSAHPYSGPGNQWFNSFLKTIPPGSSEMGKRGYAYTWWTHEFRSGGKIIPAYFALGFGGQKIFVLPEQEAVIVFTSGNYTTADTTTNILKNTVIPAITQ